MTPSPASVEPICQPFHSWHWPLQLLPPNERCWHFATEIPPNFSDCSVENWTLIRPIPSAHSWHLLKKHSNNGSCPKRIQIVNPHSSSGRNNNCQSLRLDVFLCRFLAFFHTITAIRVSSKAPKKKKKIVPAHRVHWQMATIGVVGCTPPQHKMTCHYPRH